MAIKELNHINIRTDQMEETKDFFVDVVGLEIGFRPPFDSHGYWLYCGDVPIVHLSLSDPEGDPRTIASGRGEGLDHIGLFAQDLVATERRWRKMMSHIRNVSLVAAGSYRFSFSIQTVSRSNWPLSPRRKA